MKYFLGGIQLIHTIIIGSAALVAILIWLNGRRLPSNRRNRLGILIWVDSEGDKDSLQIKKDFTNAFCELLKSSKHHHLYNVVFLERFHGKGIHNLVDLDRLATIGRFHFGLLGEVKRRLHQGQLHLFLDMQALVKHAQVEKTLSDDLSLELGTAFPRTSILPEKPDYLVLGLVAKSYGAAAQYMLAVAAYFTRDFQFSLDLLRSLKEISDRSPNGAGFPILSGYVSKRIPACLQVLSEIYHQSWRKTRDANDIIKSFEYSSELFSYPGYKYKSLISKAILLFVKDRNVGEAIRSLRDAKKIEQNDCTADLGLAFLFAYQKRLDNALARYRAAIKIGIASPSMVEIEEFIEWIVGLEPDNYSLYYCLGYINYEMKKDYSVAKGDFLKYLEQAKGDLDSPYIQKAKVYVEGCNKIQKEDVHSGDQGVGRTE